MSTTESPEPNSAAGSPRVKPSGGTILAIGGVAVAIVVALSFALKSCIRNSTGAMEKVASIPSVQADKMVTLAFKVLDGLRSRLNIAPRIVQDTQILVQETTPILELATVTRRLMLDLSYTNNWLGSEKSLKIQGTFLAKGGFDLRKRCELQVLQDKQIIVAQFPAPEVLSVEMLSHQIIRSEDGYWNKLEPADQKRVMDELYAKAKQRAAETVLNDAKKELESTVRDIASVSGAKVEVRYGESRLSGPKAPRG